MLVTNQIHSRIDYCNTIYFNLPNYLLRKLQVCMNKAARMIQGINFTDRVTPCLIDLHWLPIKARIIYKTCCIVKNILLSGKPCYLKAHLHPIRTRLQVPRVRSTYGRRSFRFYAPMVYNSFPNYLRANLNIESFKKKLKTYLFSAAYDLETGTIHQNYKV